MEKKTIKTSPPKSGRGRLQEVVVYERFQLCEVSIGYGLLFWIDGHT